MKVLKERASIHIQCAVCGSAYEVERGDPVSFVPFDYHGCFRFHAKWSCPVCAMETTKPLEETPWEWHDEIKSRGGHAGVDFADHTAEADEMGREAYNCGVQYCAEARRDGKQVGYCGGLLVGKYASRHSLPDPADPKAKELL